MTESSRDDPDATLSTERRCAASGVLQVHREDGHHPESYQVLKVIYERHIEGNTYLFNVMSSPPKNVKR